jgi:hypothetical protein
VASYLQKHGLTCKYFREQDKSDKNDTDQSQHVYLKKNLCFTPGPKVGDKEFALHPSTGLVGLTGFQEFATVDQVQNRLVSKLQLSADVLDTLIALGAAKNSTDERLISLLTDLATKFPLLPNPPKASWFPLS